MSGVRSVYRMFRFFNLVKGCEHYLLARVEQAAYSNASEVDYGKVTDEAEKSLETLRSRYGTGLLRETCASDHQCDVAGDCEEMPIGNELCEDKPMELNIWIAPHRLGGPWVNFGTAPSEAAFWEEINQNEDYRDSEGAPWYHPPATKRRVAI